MESPPPPPPPPPAATPSFVWVAILMGILVLAVQGLIVFVLLDTRSDIGRLEDSLGDVELRLIGAQPVGGGVEAPTTSTSPPASVDAPGTTQATVTTGATDTTAPAEVDFPSSPAPEFSTDEAGLALFDGDTANDPAIGTQLSDLGSVEWALGDELVVDLADGTARAIVVWAHWCPSCQELLPQLADWQLTTGIDLENVELVTIASATGAEPDNPLTDYLSEEQFPFPVLMDSDNELAARLGVNAFPFWIFVSPEGQVIGRIAGQIPADQFEALFADLEEIGASS